MTPIELRQMLERSGLTVARAAALTHVHRATVYRYLAHGSPPTWDLALRGAII